MEPSVSVSSTIPAAAPAVAAGPVANDGLTDADTIDLVGMLHRSRRILIIAGLIGLGLGIVAYLLLGPAYVASVSILVERQSSALVDTLETRTYGTRGVHVDLISSDKILRRAVEIGDLDKLPSLEAATDPIEAIATGLRVKRSSGDDRAEQNVLDISYQNARKADAISVVEAIVSAYSDYLDDIRRQRTASLRESLGEQDAKIESEIATLENRIAENRRESPLLFSGVPGAGGAVDGDRLPNYYQVRAQQVERDRRDTRAEIDAVTARINAIDELKADGATDKELEFYVLNEMSKQSQSAGSEGGGGNSALLQQGPRSQLDAELLKAQLKERRLLQTFGPGHEKVQAAKQDIQTVLASYEQYNLSPPTVAQDGVATGESLVELYRRSQENKLVELNLRLATLNESFQEAYTAAREAEQYELEDNRLTDKLEFLKNKRNLGAQSLAPLELGGDMTGFTMQPISKIRAELAIKRAIKIVGACVLAVLGLAAVLQYLREMSNTSLRTLDDVRRSLPGPVLGSVPVFPPAADADLQEAERTGLGTDLRYFHRPGSLAAEAYRSVRTALFHLIKADRRVLQITSSEAGDGKSTLVGNLGIAMAQSGKKVLIIDADMRKPRVHRLFGVFGGTGVSDVLEGELDWTEAIQSTHIERLHVLAAGSETSLPAELLSSPRLAEVLKEASDNYDWVLVDTPPLLAVSDPCIVAQHTAGMVMVVRIEKNKREAVQMATEMIGNHALPLVGVVANESPRESNRYYRTYVSDEEQSRGQQRLLAQR